jgi:ribosome-binding factor A
VRHQSPAGDRTRKVADFIRDEVALILQRQMRDPRVGMVSVNEVRVSKDLSFADIYVSSLDDSDRKSRENLIATLNGAAGWVRTELAHRHSMRTTPKPRFHYDEASERGPRLEKLIEQAVAADEAHHAAECATGRTEGRDDTP